MAYLNLVEKVAPLVDERFTHESYASGVCGNEYDFDGAKSIIIHSMGTAPMNDYLRHGTTTNSFGRYGTVTDLQASAQRMTITQDRAFTFGVDKGDNIQNNVIEINKAVTRQVDEVMIPEYDRYVFKKLASTATSAGNISSLKGIAGNAKKKTSTTAASAYDQFIEAQEWLGDHMVPDEGRVAVCSYAMCSALKQDPGFVTASDAGFDVRQKGFFGQVDGVNIIRVPSNRLPIGCGAIITHPYCSVAPQQLKEYKVHDNPIGYSGWVAEGRTIYDCFVINNKINGIYYIGMDGVSRNVNIVTTPDVNGIITAPFVNKAILQVQDYETTDLSGNALTYYYRISTQPVQPAYSSFSTTGWTAMSGATEQIGLGSSQTALQRYFVEVAQVDTDSNMVGYGVCVLNLYDSITEKTLIGSF